MKKLLLSILSASLGITLMVVGSVVKHTSGDVSQNSDDSSVKNPQDSDDKNTEDDNQSSSAKDDENTSQSKDDSSSSPSIDDTTSQMPTEIKVTSISVDSEKVKIEKGETHQIAVSILPLNATNKNIIYKSNDTSICTVSDDGLIRGLKKGNTTVEVKSESNNSASKTIEVIVLETPPVSETGWESTLTFNFNTLSKDKSIGQTHEQTDKGTITQYSYDESFIWSNNQHIGNVVSSSKLFSPSFNNVNDVRFGSGKSGGSITFEFDSCLTYVSIEIAKYVNDPTKIKVNDTEIDESVLTKSIDSSTTNYEYDTLVFDNTNYDVKLTNIFTIESASSQSNRFFIRSMNFCSLSKELLDQKKALLSAIENAIAEIDKYYLDNKDKYDKLESKYKDDIDNKLTNVKDNINNCKNVEDVEKLVEKFKQDFETAVSSDFNDVREAALSTISEKNESLYAPADREKYKTAWEKADAAIKSDTATKDSIKQAIEEYQNVIETLTTQAELTSYINEKKEEVNNYESANISKLTGDEKTTVSNEKQTTLTSIDNAQSKDAVDDAFAIYKETIDNLIIDLVKADAIAEVNSFDSSLYFTDTDDGQDSDSKKVDDAKTAALATINSATGRSTIDSALVTFHAIVDVLEQKQSFIENGIKAIDDYDSEHQDEESKLNATDTTTLTTKRNDAKTNIQNATKKSQIDSIVQTYINDIESLLINDLIKDKSALISLVLENDYFEDISSNQTKSDKQTVLDAKAKFNSDVSGINVTRDDVNTAYDNFNRIINSLTKKAKAKADGKQVILDFISAHQSEINALSNASNSGQKPDSDKATDAKNDADSKIDSATKQDTIDDAINEYKNVLSTLGIYDSIDKLPALSTVDWITNANDITSGKYIIGCTNGSGSSAKTYIMSNNKKNGGSPVSSTSPSNLLAAEYTSYIVGYDTIDYSFYIDVTSIENNVAQLSIRNIGNNTSIGKSVNNGGLYLGTNLKDNKFTFSTTGVTWTISGSTSLNFECTFSSTIRHICLNLNSGASLFAPYTSNQTSSSLKLFRIG